MRRREFITLVVGAASAWPLAAHAQEPAAGKIPHIAYVSALSPATANPSLIPQFKGGLAENGLIDGQNIAVDYLWAEGNSERMKQLAAELAGRDLDVIVTAGPQLVRAFLETGTKTPIVFAILNDPIGDGFIKSLAQPGGNVTGPSMAGIDLESKRVEVLKDAVPIIAKVLILHDPSMGAAGTDEARAGAHALGLQSVFIDTSDAAKFGDVFAGAVAQGVNGVVGMASPIFNYERKKLVALAAQHRLPSIWEAGVYVEDGGLLSYGPSFPDMYRRSAGYVAKILKGQKPADLPVEQPVKFELAINLKTAKALGLTITQSLLLRADEVIE